MSNKSEMDKAWNDAAMTGTGVVKVTQMSVEHISIDEFREISPEMAKLVDQRMAIVRQMIDQQVSEACTKVVNAGQPPYRKRGGGIVWNPGA